MANERTERDERGNTPQGDALLNPKVIDDLRDAIREVRSTPAVQPEREYYGYCDKVSTLHVENEHCKNWVPQLDEPVASGVSSTGETAQAPARTDAPHEIEVLCCKHCGKLAISVDGIRQDTNSCAEEGHGDGKCAGQWTVLVKSAWLAARGKENGR